LADWSGARSLPILDKQGRAAFATDADRPSNPVRGPYAALRSPPAMRSQPGASGADGMPQAQLHQLTSTGCAAALTPREREMLQWLATGKTDADIAQLIGISRRTVQKHLEHVYVKLGVETRTAAVMRGLDLRPGP